MQVIKTDLVAQLRETHSLKFGDFYFFDDFIISEIHDGALFNWDCAQVVIDLAKRFYGKKKVHYISNRIYNYSIVPQDWVKFYKNRNTIKSFSVVTYNSGGLMNMMFERMFCRTKIRQFEGLKQAIDHINGENGHFSFETATLKTV